MKADLVANEALIDQEVIGKLFEIQERTRDPAFFGSVLDLYFEHTPPLLTNLAEAIRSHDITSVQRIAHRLKGSSVSVGAAALASLCANLEQAANNGALEEAGYDADQAQTLYDRTQVILTTLRNKPQSASSLRMAAQSLV